MKNFTVKSQKSVNGVNFGETRQAVRKVFGDEFREVKKSPVSPNTMDAYKECHIFYTADNHLEAIEIFPENTIIIDNKQFSTEYDIAKVWIKDNDPSAIEADDGITSQRLGLNIYAPNGKIESILFATREYFDF